MRHSGMKPLPGWSISHWNKECMCLACKAGKLTIWKRSTSCGLGNNHDTWER